MNLAEIIQACILSGALGFVYLGQLQRKGGYSAYVSKTEATYLRVTMGVIVYILYIFVHIGIRWLTFRYLIHASKPTSLQEQLIVALSAVVSALLMWGLTAAYCGYRKKKRKPGDMQILSSREQAFMDPGEGGALRIDVFKLEGAFVASGYLTIFDVEQDLCGDILMHPLGEYDKPVATEAEVIAAKRYKDLYFDLKNGLKYYVTPTALPSTSSPGAVEQAPSDD